MKEDAEVTPRVVGKRVSGKLINAIRQAPLHVQGKWSEIQKLAGKRGSGIFRHKKEFLLKWVEDPTWAVPTDLVLSRWCLYIRHCLYKALPV